MVAKEKGNGRCPQQKIGQGVIKLREKKAEKAGAAFAWQ
jgi:hypothetical protein